MPNSEAQIYTVHLMSPWAWRPLLTEGFKHLPDDTDTAHLARQGLLALHNRHVGITPLLMAHLAPLLQPASRYDSHQGNLWQPVITRLTTALTGAQSKPTSGAGLLLNRRPAYVLLRVIAPLIDQACRRLGHCYLFCGDNRPGTIKSSKEYLEYSNNLAKMLKKISQDQEDESLQLFWQERALTLSTLSRPGLEVKDTGSLLPEPELTALALFLRLQPNIKEGPSYRQLRRAATQNDDLNAAGREGGYRGATMTRKMEDFHRALPSERLRDPATIAQRLSDGYQIFERQAKSSPVRDLLLVGMLPGHLSHPVHRDLVKACWFEFAMRLGLNLQERGLRQTEFRWVEGDAFSRIRTCVYLLKEIPDLGPISQGRPSQYYRQVFLSALGWLPRFLDGRDAFSPLKGQDAGSVAGRELRRAYGWFCSAWGEQQESQDRSGYLVDSNTTGRLKAEEFSHTHIMTFLPGNQLDDRAGQARSPVLDLAGLTSQLKSRRRFSGNASITWVPESRDDDWRFEAHRRNQRLIVSSDERGTTVNELSGQLIQVWLEQIVQEMSNA